MKRFCKITTAFLLLLLVCSCKPAERSALTESAAIRDSFAVHFVDSFVHRLFVDSVSMLFTHADTIVQLTRVSRQSNLLDAHKRDTVHIEKHDTLFVQTQAKQPPDIPGMLKDIALIIFVFVGFVVFRTIVGRVNGWRD